jgi:hypothetical protein
VGVKRFEEGDRRRWYRFNVSVSNRERKRHDEVLSEDEKEARSLSWLHKSKYYKVT